jgi:uncharacterized protein DUF2742
MTSQQVSWWSVHEFVAAHLQVEQWPMVGTPDWCELDDDDPVKWAAILDAAQHWALRVDTDQSTLCDASRDVSAAVDWSAVSRVVRAHQEFYAARPWLRRVAS